MVYVACGLALLGGVILGWLAGQAWDDWFRPPPLPPPSTPPPPPPPRELPEG